MHIADGEKRRLLEISWKRCQSRGLDRSGNSIVNLLTRKHLDEVLKKNQLLIESAKLVFQHIGQSLKGYPYNIDLFDAQGCLMYSHQQTEIQHNNQLVIGSQWGEPYQGTSAISFSIEHQKPITLIGREHFFLDKEMLICSSSPIFDNNGNMVAIVNYSTTKNEVNNYPLTVATLAAKAITNTVFTKKLEIENKSLLNEVQKYNKSYLLDPPIQSSSVKYNFDQISDTCPAIHRAIQLSKKAAHTDLSIFVNGESGTGKEVFAQSIHAESSRAGGPFVAVNCSAIPENLIESELFGYKKGAFTGASHSGSIGKFRAANKGTIFLDEIGDMSLQAQSSLLRVLQEREVVPIGDHVPIPIDVRVISATNKNLLKEIEDGRFREDLYYRLNEINLLLPPLRMRKDILELAEALLNELTTTGMQFSKRTVEVIQSYSWPGNIRELKNVITQACFLTDGKVIEPWHLQLNQTKKTSTPSKYIEPEYPIQTLEEVEKMLIKQALERNNGNMTQAANQLGITRHTIYRKMKLYEELKSKKT
ncbi:sigma-54-dependent Fis family transcriptional regulator [Sporosarcina soli]|uniref:Sigma-54-dependent Fis family transcriptional regulator n=1 Tax=Sporosarcina soli TaxID=334736 RepID=A0ABW0TP73_9BACL